MTRTPEPGIPDGAAPAGASGHADGPTAAGPSSSVTTLRRPPVRQSTVVRSDVRHTFDVFVKTIGIWWPVSPFSAGKDRVRDVVIEQRTGGRVYETWADGTEVDWGALLVWDPPARFVMTWNQTPVPTEVELSFAALGPALTRITVEHRGWDALTDEQLAEDCALPGGYSGGSYSAGWVQILGRAAAALGPAGTPGPADTPGPAGTPGPADADAFGRADALGPAEAPGPADPETTDPRSVAPVSADPDAIQLTSYEVVLLRHTRRGRDFDEKRKERIFREHLAYTLGLVASGEQLAAGPIPDGPAEDEDICGLGLFQKGSVDAVRQLVEQDPGVQQGLYRIDVMTWLTRPGTVAVPQRANARD